MSTYFDDSFFDKDTIRCVLGNIGTPIKSDSIVLTINPYVTPIALISSSNFTSICTGDKVGFAAVSIYGGAKPAFQWLKNGIDIPAATDSIYFSSTLTSNDAIRCRITSNASCITTSTVVSKAEIVKVSPRYKFTGNGDWNDPVNWENNVIPPLRIPPCAQVIIDPVAGGECVLNYSLMVADSSSLKVSKGKTFRILGDLVIGRSGVHYDYSNDPSMDVGFGFKSASIEELLEIPASETVDVNSLPSVFKTSGLPVSIDLPLPGDQGRIESCTGWAVGYALLSYWNNLLENNRNGQLVYDDVSMPNITSNFDKITSPSFIYNQIATEEGSSFIDAFKLIQNNGCCKWADMPGDVVSQPVSKAVENARDYRNVNFQFFHCRMVDIGLIKAYLQKGIPFAFGCNLDYTFQLNGDFIKANRNLFRNVLIHPDGRIVYMDYDQEILKNGVKLGSHAMVICGFDDKIRAFKVLNSWGRKRGNEGYYWIDYEFFKKFLMYPIPFVPMYPELFWIGIPRADLTVVTKIPKQITSYPFSVTTGYELTNLGDVTVYKTGVCYSRNQFPTTAWGAEDSTLYSTTGEVTIDKFEPGITYYIRAFAKTNKGVVYGKEVSFATDAPDLSGVYTLVSMRGVPVGGHLSEAVGWGGGATLNSGSLKFTSRLWNLTFNYTSDGEQKSTTSITEGRYEYRKVIYDSINDPNASWCTGKPHNVAGIGYCDQLPPGYLFQLLIGYLDSNAGKCVLQEDGKTLVCSQAGQTVWKKEN